MHVDECPLSGRVSTLKLQDRGAGACAFCVVLCHAANSEIRTLRKIKMNQEYQTTQNKQHPEQHNSQTRQTTRTKPNKQSGTPGIWRLHFQEFRKIACCVFFGYLFLSFVFVGAFVFVILSLLVNCYTARIRESTANHKHTKSVCAQGVGAIRRAPMYFLAILTAKVIFLNIIYCNPGNTAQCNAIPDNVHVCIYIYMYIHICACGMYRYTHMYL